MAVADVKISCRNVWKVFGEYPSRFFPGGDGRVPDPASHYEQILGSDHLPAACDISFEVREGEMLVIMGLSGSGKSTVVRCLSRLIEPTAGHVLLDGEDLMQVDDRELIEIRRHKMGMVFQHFGLLPHLTVLENVAFPLKIQGVPQEKRERQGPRGHRPRRARGPRALHAEPALRRTAAAGGTRTQSGREAGIVAAR